MNTHIFQKPPNLPISSLLILSSVLLPFALSSPSSRLRAADNVGVLLFPSAIGPAAFPSLDVNVVEAFVGCNLNELNSSVRKIFVIAAVCCCVDDETSKPAALFTVPMTILVFAWPVDVDVVEDVENEAVEPPALVDAIGCAVVDVGAAAAVAAADVGVAVAVPLLFGILCTR